MALIVETGAGLETSESYVSVAEADEYHASRGNAAWDLIDDKEALLRQATDYMLQTYRGKWKGYRTTAIQALDWPRAEVALNDVAGPSDFYISNEIVPVEVRRACAELALRASTEQLLPDETQQVIKETVGPISVQYSPHTSQRKRFVTVDRALALFLKANGVTAKVTRS